MLHEKEPQINLINNKEDVPDLYEKGPQINLINNKEDVPDL